MKRKMLAVLLLVAIFAAFAGQVYAMTSGMNGRIIEEEPNKPVDPYIYHTEYRRYKVDEIYVSVESDGNTYSGNLPYSGMSGGWYKYSGILYLDSDY